MKRFFLIVALMTALACSYYFLGNGANYMLTETQHKETVDSNLKSYKAKYLIKEPDAFTPKVPKDAMQIVKGGKAFFAIATPPFSEEGSIIRYHSSCKGLQDSERIGNLSEVTKEFKSSQISRFPSEGNLLYWAQYFSDDSFFYKLTINWNQLIPPAYSISLFSYADENLNDESYEELDVAQRTNLSQTEAILSAQSVLLSKKYQNARLAARELALATQYPEPLAENFATIGTITEFLNGKPIGFARGEQRCQLTDGLSEAECICDFSNE